MKKLIIVLAVLTVFPGVDTASAAVSDNPVNMETEKSPKKKKDIRKVVFLVSLHCEKCVEKINGNIAFERGVRNMTVSLENQTVEIEYDAARTSVEKLTVALKKLGYEAKVFVPENK